MKLCEIDVLGTKYTVYSVEDCDAAVLDARDAEGVCDYTTHEIMLRASLREPSPDRCANLDVEWRRVMRHEIVHAFLYESGMTGHDAWEGSFCRNELLVDWIAVQAPKIYKAFQEAGCL